MTNAKIACPNCHSTFKVPANAVGAEGRKLRCSNCGNNWHAQPSELLHELHPHAAIIVSNDKAIAAAIFVEELLSPPAIPPAAIFVDKLLASSVQNETWLIEEQQNILPSTPTPLPKKEDSFFALEDDSATPANAPPPLISEVIVEAIDEAVDIEQAELEDDTYDEFASLFTNPQATKLEKPARPAFYTNTYLLLVANFACFVVLAFALLVDGRDAIIAKIPASSAFYRLIGYQQTSHLQLADLTFTSSKSKYIVKGKIINNAKHASLVPTIRARIFDKRGNVTGEWELASNNSNTADHVISVGGEKTFSLKLPANVEAAIILAVDIGSNMELHLRK